MPISNVFNIDCMEGMKGFPDKFFDLAIVDPPYGINYAKRKHKTVNSLIQYIPKEWDDERPSKEYFDELKRISIHQIIWGGNYFLDYLGNSKGMICWDKCQPEGLDQAMCEFAWTSIDKSAKVIKTSIQQIQFTRIHPTEKPIKLYTWILDNYAKPNDKILDTHLGSQSSRIAAYKLGFDFWGYEIDADYFKQGCERFEKAIAQPLFDNVIRSEQKELFNGK